MFQRESCLVVHRHIRPVVLVPESRIRSDLFRFISMLNRCNGVPEPRAIPTRVRLANPRAASS